MDAKLKDSPPAPAGGLRPALFRAADEAHGGPKRDRNTPSRMDIPMNDIRFETWLDEVLEGTSYAFTEHELFEMYRAGDSPAEAIQEGEDLLDDGLFG